MKVYLNITKEKREELIKNEPLGQNDGLVEWVTDDVVEVNVEDFYKLQTILWYYNISFSITKDNWFKSPTFPLYMCNNLDHIYNETKTLLENNGDLKEKKLECNEMEMLEALSNLVKIYEKHLKKVSP